jgi:Pyridoxamine 5'-phosphate oxidase
VTASLPPEVQQVFDRFRTTAFATVDRHGLPVCWPGTPHYEPGDPCIDVTPAAGEAEQALDAEANPKVAVLFSDPAGSGMDAAPQVLVQGTADLGEAGSESSRVRVRPERVYVWPAGDPTAEPQLFDAHMEEVRSGHDEEPERPQAAAEGGEPVWDDCIDDLGDACPEAVLSLVAPDGFPFSVRVKVKADGSAGRVRIAGDALGVPVQTGRACLTAEDFQVRGDLVEENGGWVVVPHETEKRRDAN